MPSSRHQEFHDIVNHKTEKTFITASTVVSACCSRLASLHGEGRYPVFLTLRDRLEGEIFSVTNSRRVSKMRCLAQLLAEQESA